MTTKVERILRELRTVAPKLYQLDMQVKELYAAYHGDPNFVAKSKRLIEYYRDHTDEDIDTCNRLEKICQLIITNPEVLDQVDWEDPNGKVTMMANLDRMLYEIDNHRQQSAKFRQDLAMVSMVIR